jgi:hypothetical protein
MAHIRRFNESIGYYPDWLDRDLLQKVIDGMKHRSEHDEESFKESIREFNNLYPVRTQERLPSIFGKRVADWIDLDLIQDVIDRMNPNICVKSEKYKKILREEFI